MDKRTKATIAGTGIASIVVTGVCMMLLVPAANAHHCKGPHANDPGCEPGGGGGGGGGGGSNDTVPLMTVFDCPVSGTDHESCPITGAHNRIQADVAATPYENDVDNVLNRLGSTGRFALSTGAKKKDPKLRHVYWDLTHVNGGVTLPNTGYVVTTTDQITADGFGHRTVIHVGTEYVDQGGDLRTMAQGETISGVDLWLDLNVGTGKGGGGVLVRFSPYGTDQCAGRITSGADVTRTDDGSGKRQWTIDVAPGAVACVHNFAEDLGDYVFGPLQLIADEL